MEAHDSICAHVHQIFMCIRYVPRNELARWGLVRSMATVVGGQAALMFDEMSSEE
jgi:hypothetical protein